MQTVAKKKLRLALPWARCHHCRYRARVKPSGVLATHPNRLNPCAGSGSFAFTLETSGSNGKDS